MYKVTQTEQFSKDIKYYVKKKGFVHIGDDIRSVTNELQKGNLIGDTIPGLRLDDSNTFKVRVANTDTNVGKSNGYRIIYYVVKNDCEIFLLTMYYKKDDNRIPSNDEIVRLIKEYCL